MILNVALAIVGIALSIVGLSMLPDNTSRWSLFMVVLGTGLFSRGLVLLAGSWSKR